MKQPLISGDLVQRVHNSRTGIFEISKTLRPGFQAKNGRLKGMSISEKGEVEIKRASGD
jgi:hypothetical protein